MRICGRRFDTGEVVSLDMRSGRIDSLQPEELDKDVPWIAPGFVDLQVNGFGGEEFIDPELAVEGVIRIGRAMDAFGVTSYCPTVTTHSYELLSRAMRTLAAACDQSPEVQRQIAGIHLEGPYISGAEGPRGAHPAAHCRPPDWDEFQRLQEAAGGRIRLLTLSPEYDESATFIARVADSGVLVAIGHASANSKQIRDAVDAGARLSTHLGNGCYASLPRHHNCIWDQLAEDRLVASLIADGQHLPPAVVKCFVRAKTPQRCVLISDVVGLAGMPPGRYFHKTMGEVEVLADGRLVVAGQSLYLAGAGLPLTQGIANVVRFAGVGLPTAIEMASIQPAALIGQSQGGIAVGARADVVLFDLPDCDDGPLRVRATFRAGELVYGRAAVC